MSKIRAVIFDLDGVICNTAKYHYQAWKKLANVLGFEFSLQDNEMLKGISRRDSLEVLLKIGKIEADEQQKMEWAEKKNKWYIEYISEMNEDEVLPGVIEFIEKLRKAGIKTALGSASKNTRIILERLKMKDRFDVISDGTMVEKAKPNPDVFLKAAELLGVKAEECLVYEDAQAGIEAATNAGMKCVGIGDPEILGKADWVVTGFGDPRQQKILKIILED